MIFSIRQLLFAIGLFFASSIYSQDLIKLIDGTEVSGFLASFNEKEFSFRVDQYQTTSVSTVLFSDVKELVLGDPISKFQVFNDSLLLSQDLILKQKAFRSAIFTEKKRLSNFEVRAILTQNPDAYKQFVNGRTLKNLGAVLMVSGGVLTGASLLVFTGPDQLNMVYLGVGASALLLGIVSSYSGNEKVKKAIELYNTNRTQSKNASSFNFGLQQNGVGFSYQF